MYKKLEKCFLVHADICTLWGESFLVLSFGKQKGIFCLLYEKNLTYRPAGQFAGMSLWRLVASPSYPAPEMRSFRRLFVVYTSASYQYPMQKGAERSTECGGKRAWQRENMIILFCKHSGLLNHTITLKEKKLFLSSWGR